HHYDLVFLDHMMPGMDGIETASAIRALREERFLSLPLVALTANAIFGMREMFLEHGFNDYLAKPIEIGKLDEIMARWIPRDKQVRVESRKDAGGAGGPQAGDGGGPEAGRGAFEMPPLDTRGSVSIAGLDIAEGMNLTGSSTWAMYCDVLALYCSDISERLGYLQPGIREEALSEFCTQVHALKGASASIGAAALAQQAADLEAAGKSGDLAAVEERLGPFLREAEAMAERIRAALAGT
ncbi:MAG: response regulator, partial [Spirochaetaceae bacterium]|nr:response regulator [Spirochaetaceae bacterium]